MKKKNTLTQSVNDLNHFVLFLDNLPAQEADDFKNAVAGLNGAVWFGSKDAADLSQLVNGGLGQMLKALVARENQFWFDQEENADKWYGNNTEPFWAMERCILITCWVAVHGEPSTGQNMNILDDVVGKNQVA